MEYLRKRQTDDLIAKRTRRKRQTMVHKTTTQKNKDSGTQTPLK
jgi:hypothetical protein